MSDPDRLAEFRRRYTMPEIDALRRQQEVGVSDPDRLAEIQARRAELDGQIAPWARPYRDDIDWLVGEVERLRALLEPTVIVSPPPAADPGNDEAPLTRKG